jgi:hypothetical protein
MPLESSITIVIMYIVQAAVATVINYSARGVIYDHKMFIVQATGRLKQVLLDRSDGTKKRMLSEKHKKLNLL